MKGLTYILFYSHHLCPKKWIWSDAKAMTLNYYFLRLCKGRVPRKMCNQLLFSCQTTATWIKPNHQPRWSPTSSCGRLDIKTLYEACDRWIWDILTAGLTVKCYFRPNRVNRPSAGSVREPLSTCPSIEQELLHVLAAFLLRYAGSVYWVFPDTTWRCECDWHGRCLGWVGVIWLRCRCHLHYRRIFTFFTFLLFNTNFKMTIDGRLMVPEHERHSSFRHIFGRGTQSLHLAVIVLLRVAV